MNAIPRMSAPSSDTTDRVRRAAALLVLTSLAMGSAVAAQEQTGEQAQATPQEQTPAVLKMREADFVYRGSVQLPCHELRGRVASVLLALGARQDVDVRVTGCSAVPEEPTETWQSQSDRWQTSSDRWRMPSSRFGNASRRREQSAHVNIRAMLPVEVTPEVLEEMDRDKARRELVSRVTGNPGAALTDPIVLPAQRQLVTLSHRTLELEPEDCEWLEQMSAGVFRQLDMRVVRRGATCDRDGRSRMPPQLTVETLMPVMPSGLQLVLLRSQTMIQDFEHFMTRGHSDTLFLCSLTQ